MEAYQSAALSSDDPEQHGLENLQKFCGTIFTQSIFSASHLCSLNASKGLENAPHFLLPFSCSMNKSAYHK